MLKTWYSCQVRSNLKLEIVKKCFVKAHDLIHHDSVYLDSNIDVGIHQYKGQIVLNVSGGWKMAYKNACKELLLKYFLSSSCVPLKLVNLVEKMFFSKGKKGVKIFNNYYFLIIIENFRIYNTMLWELENWKLFQRSFQ